jgi:hypothetical protein
MWTLSSPTGRDFYSLKVRRRRLTRNSFNTQRTLRSTGLPSRPRSELIRIEKRKLPSDLFMKVLILI